MININPSHIAKLQTERIITRMQNGIGSNKGLRKLFLTSGLNDADMKELVDNIAYSVACSIALMLDEKSAMKAEGFS